ncbi:MAG: MATE family efflux transporter [Clostridia bacterium]|nr:MATE family efflux transporter [Clostridia bacterium]
MAKNANKTELFESMPIPKAVMNLSIPMVLSSLVMVVYNLTDTYFVGMLNDPIQTAAVTLAATLLLAFNAINNLFGVGGSSMMSRALGAKDFDRVKRSCSFSFWCCFVFSLVYSAVYIAAETPLLTLLGATGETIGATKDYCLWTVSIGALPAILHVVMAYFIRSEGSATHASIGTISGCVVNMILDPIFILPWGLNMGASGAGLATLIGNTFATLYFFGFLIAKRGKTFVCIDPRKAVPNKDIVKGVFGVGVPASIQNLLNVVGMTILNNFAAGYGPTVVASIGISYKVYMVPMQITLGASQGVMPLIGYNYASGNIARMKKALFFTYKVCLSFLVVFAVGMFALSPKLIALFMKDSEVIRLGGFYLKGYALGLVFLCIDFLGVGCCQAIGKGGLTLLFAVLRKIVLEIPFLFILNHFFHEKALSFAQGSAEFILAIASLIILIRLIRSLEKNHTPNLKSDE